MESVTVYKDAVEKTCDAMDANIKSLYQLMSKCEELSKVMAPIYKQAESVYPFQWQSMTIFIDKNMYSEYKYLNQIV